MAHVSLTCEFDEFAWLFKIIPIYFQDYLFLWLKLNFMFFLNFFLLEIIFCVFELFSCADIKNYF
jgi:hypothetical protein